MTQVAYRVDYAAHPAFQSDVESLALPSAEVASFDSKYLHLTNSGSSGASDRDWQQLQLLASEVLARLQGQTDSGLQVMFLEELWRNLGAIIHEQRDYFLGRHVLPGQNAVTEKPTALEAQRFYIDLLPAEVTVELTRIAEPQVALFRRLADDGKLSRTDLSAGQGSTVRALTRTLNDAFRANGTLDAVSEYSGRSMVVSGLAVELSDARSSWWKHKLPTEAQPQTMYAHLDETISVPKAIVYLSDVELGMGETSCYPGLLEEMKLGPLQELLGRALATVMEPPSKLPEALGDGVYHQAFGSAGLRRLFMTLPEELRFNSHLGWDVLPGSSLELQMVEMEQPLLGPKGTHIVFDGGRLFHRGGLIRHGQRVALQVIFRGSAEVRTAARIRRRVRRLLGGGSLP